MKIQAVLTLLPFLAGLGDADYSLWAGSCFSFGNDQTPKIMTQGSNACRAQGWFSLEGDSTGSSRNPCNQNEVLEYRRVGSNPYDIFGDNTKVGDCVQFNAPRPSRDSRMGQWDMDSCFIVAMYNCRIPTCNSRQ